MLIWDYNTDIVKQDNDHEMYVRPTEQFKDISIVPRLVDIRNSFMRI